MSIVTLREWVLPPRPKPGRKPSVDTPASKRKAQNRAAQRAFRERRATRVQELEEKLLEVEKEKEVKEMGLVNTINKLKFENQFLLKSLEQLRLDFNSFRSSMSNGASPRPESQPFGQLGSLLVNSATTNPYKSELSQSAQHLLNFAKSPVNHSTGSPALLQYSVQQILPAPSADSPPAVQMFRPVLNHSRPSQVTPLSQDNSPNKGNKSSTEDFDCGVCLKEQCLCEDVGLKSLSKSLEETLNSFTPMPAVSLRGKRKSAVSEIDFTSEFSFRKMPDLKRLCKDSLERTVTREPENNTSSAFNEDSPLENCGFCSDDTPCVCREAAKEAARLSASLKPKEEEEQDEAGPTLLPPIQMSSSAIRKSSLPVMHPGPTLEIREFANMNGSVPTVVAKGEEAPAETAAPKEEKSGCTGNPGTCNQCQMDPMSTLFCTTVASKAALEKQTTRPKEKKELEKVHEESEEVELLDSQSSRAQSLAPLTNPSTPLPSTPSGSNTGIFIPCADAYKTLSRHKRFNSVDFSSLVGRLTTRGMLVEVQSVANVLRELDRKVYD